MGSGSLKAKLQFTLDQFNGATSNSTRRFACSGPPVAILALSRYFELHRTFIVLLNARSGF